MVFIDRAQIARPCIERNYGYRGTAMPKPTKAKHAAAKIRHQRNSLTPEQRHKLMSKATEIIDAPPELKAKGIQSIIICSASAQPFKPKGRPHRITMLDDFDHMES